MPKPKSQSHPQPKPSVPQYEKGVFPFQTGGIFPKDPERCAYSACTSQLAATYYAPIGDAAIVRGCTEEHADFACLEIGKKPWYKEGRTLPGLGATYDAYPLKAFEEE